MLVKEYPTLRKSTGCWISRELALIFGILSTGLSAINPYWGSLGSC